MSKKLIELRDARNTSITAARALLDKAESEKRELNTDEQTQWDSHMADEQRFATAIGNEERQIEAERQIAGQHFEDNSEAGSENRDSGEGVSSAEYREAFEKRMRFGPDGLSLDEKRALSAGAGTEGGFLIMPQQMASGMLKDVDDMVFMRQRATKFQLPMAASLGVPTMDSDVDDANWTPEIATGSEDTGLAFGKRELSPNALAKRIKISNKLLRQVPGIEAIVRARLAYKFGTTQEAAFMTGSGAKQPLGVFTASADGISTGRDIASGNTGTAFTFDGLINAKYSCKSQYQRVAEWLFHRDAVSMLAKLKDGDGQYIWQPSKVAADPDMLLGRPVNMSEFAPNTFTTGLYVGLFGDFSHYWIADAMNIELQRLTELYAETNQTGIIGRLETDGMPVLEEAFARVTLG